MFYESLFNPSIHRPVKACLTGAGEFGASFLFQAQGMPLLEVPAVCTRTVQRAVDAYENAGIPASKVRVCESAEDAKKAYADGFNVVVDSFEYIADLPLDVLVESSGAPEASAAAAELAIERGMHVVMVSKETDSVVGSILARKAAERGLVYTTGDGEVIFKKYSPVGELSSVTTQYVDALSKSFALTAFVCDRDRILAASGAGRRDLVDRSVSQPLEKLMDSRKLYASSGDPEKALLPCEGAQRALLCVCPIIAAGDVTGAVGFLTEDRAAQPDAAQEKAAAVAAAFLAKQMEE